MKQLKFIICCVKQKVQQTKQLFFRFDWMTILCFRTNFSKRLVYIRINRLKNSNRWKLITKFLSIFTIHFKNSIYSTKIYFIKKFINESFNFLFNRTSSYWAFIHKFKSSKIVVKTLLNRVKFSLLKQLTKLERWIISKLSSSKRQTTVKINNFDKNKFDFKFDETHIDS